MSQERLERIAKSAERLALLQDQAKAERERRDDLIREEMAEGTAYKVCARAARRRPSRVAQIIGEG